ncbi:hypothetical protein ACFZB9_31130 [Kitasatospora sp. NPDC008050]|uniref:hypothetical protein n=1 Tax=Kitasatospora sp. NPDC008050 TaxID=3364021 RepID=UPI0036E7675B
MAGITDPRHTGLYVSAATLLTSSRLHPDPAAHLAHGYVDLCLSAWPSARGAELDLATRWALWTWLADDLLDDGLNRARRDEADELYRDLVAAPTEGARLMTGHPLVLALAALSHETSVMMTAHWWARYRQQLHVWLGAAFDSPTGFTRPERVPTLRE